MPSKTLRIPQCYYKYTKVFSKTKNLPKSFYYGEECRDSEFREFKENRDSKDNKDNKETRVSKNNLYYLCRPCRPHRPYKD